MQNTKYDVVGIGNAIVDILAHADDEFLISHNLHKGGMALITEAQAEALYQQMGPAVVVSGGSAANTIVGAASLGSTVAFIGKVKADDAGQIFNHDMKSLNIHYSTPANPEGPATAKSYILVTPDGQRTMNTFLGACQSLTEADIDEDLIASAGITYLEGYLWDPPAAKKAFLKAAGIARENKRSVVLSLSDAFCVDRYRDEFLNLIRLKTVDIIFANESELHALYQTSDFSTALKLLQNETHIGIVTRGSQGCVVVHGGHIIETPALPIPSLVDTTGAGDLFAAGFLSGLSRGKNIEICSKLGILAASEVIQHIGARPESDLKQLASQSGLIL